MSDLIGGESTLADTIVSVETSTFTVPLARPVRNGTAVIRERDYVIVTISTRDGLSGTACALAREAPIQATITQFLAPRLLGLSSSALQSIWATLNTAGELFLGRSGSFMRALSLVDIALWDLHGRRAGLSVANLLGGAGSRVPILMALGYYRSTDDPVRIQDEYELLVERGFRRFKIMAGGAPLAEDVRRIQAVLEVLPSDARLAVDVNAAWRTAREALEFVNAVPIELDFIEDPFRPDNRTALQQFRARNSTPVAIGEWESGSRRFLDLIRNDLLDVVRIDATAAGGISEWQRIAALASAHDKRILPHYYPEIHSHLVAATPIAEAVEVVPTLTGADNFEELVSAVPWNEAPTSEVSDRAGIGVQWDWLTIDRYRQRPAEVVTSAPVSVAFHQRAEPVHAHVRPAETVGTP